MRRNEEARTSGQSIPHGKDFQALDPVVAHIKDEEKVDASPVRALGARRLRALRPGALRAPGPGLELRLRVPEALDLN